MESPVNTNSLGIGNNISSTTFINPYRYGFNGKEKDNEVSGRGNEYDFGARIYDPRLGRWLSLDPNGQKYPDMSPYNFSADNPILFVDKDGKDVIANDPEAQALVLKTLNTTFGEFHGYAFENNKLVHKCEPPVGLTTEQALLYKYFDETIVKSTTPVIVNVNSLYSYYTDANGEADISIGQEGNAFTQKWNGTKKLTAANPGNAPMIVASTSPKIDIVVSTEATKKGLTAYTNKGLESFSPAEILLHELAHSIVQVIMDEKKGQFNGIDFNIKTQQERDDWAIRYVNTLIQSQNSKEKNPLKKRGLGTNEGQHGMSVPANGQTSGKSEQPLTQ